MRGSGGNAQRKPPQQPKEDGIAAKAIDARNGAAAEKEAEQQDEQEVDDEVEHVELTTATILEMRTLRGDLAQSIINFIKDNFQDQPWGKLSESRQQSIIDAAQRLAAKLVHESVRLAKLDGTEPFEMTIASFAVDPEKGVVAKIVMPRDDDTMKAVNNALGKPGYFIPMNAKDFMGERKTIVPDNVGDLGIPKVKPEDAVPGHAIKLEVTGEGEEKSSVATCECGAWSSSVTMKEIETQAPLIAAHLAQARLANLGRGPVDATGAPLKADGETGEVAPPIGTEPATHKEAAA